MNLVDSAYLVIIMSLSLACALVVVGIIATCFCEPINFQKCDNTTPDIEEVNITPCPSQPCKFHHGMNVTVSVTFIAAKSSASLEAEIFGILAGIPVKFNMPNPDGCKSNITCPIKAGDQYTYAGLFNVLPTYPNIRLNVKWDLRADDKSYLFCFVFPMEIDP